ncbi:Hint domain-containing protein [Acetobacter thailandicus]|uniref:Hint domain-containing protein n=2 Tax=Acetobacter TaxID=434 RepID=UPI001BAE2103|nr:Hint domain-containing protein [Acetobacter thailandicus]MBS0961406.1 Hint domain-containing protein [Acetobacter thailandicus]
MAILYNPPSGASIVSGGYWIAIKGSDGITYYESATGTGSSATPIAGATKYTGPIIISRGSLTVASGAVASGAYISGGYNNLYILSGGVLESSVNVNGWTYVSSGGISSDNTLVSDAGHVYAGGSSVSDSIIAGNSQDGNGDTFYINSGGYVGGNTVVGSGATLDATAGNAIIVSPVNVENGGTLKITSAGQTLGSQKENNGIANTDPTVSYPEAPSGASIVSGGYWIAIKGSDGITYYESATGTGSSAAPIAGATKYTGPIIISRGSLTVASGAVASGAYISGGYNNLYILSGGILESSVNVNGWTYVSSGGISSDNTLVSDAGHVYAGGSAVSTTFLAGNSSDGGSDTYYIDKGSFISGNTINGSGSILNINSQANIEQPITYYITEPHPGYLSANTVSGGYWIAIKGSDGITYYESATGTGSSATPIAGATKYTGPIIISRGSLTVASGAVASGAYISGGTNNLYILSGGTLESSVNVNGWTYVSSGGISSDNTLVSDAGHVYAGGSSVSDSIIAGNSQDGNGDTFYINSGGVITSAYVGSAAALIVQAGGTSIATTLEAGSTYDVLQAESEICFLPGSLIKTPSGITPVQDLSMNDEVIAYVNSIEVIRHITWVGRSYCTVRPHLPDDEAGYPVRILKNAVAEGVPFKDMLITSEHCLFFDGRFIPVRMLVNGRSVFYDKSITSYDYYHIETDEHAVIMADGVLTESYLDTGNRQAFYQHGKLVAFTPSRNLTWDDAAAPLDVSQQFAENIFRHIEERADQMNLPHQNKTAELTYDPDLHLLTQTGDVIRQIRRQNGRALFMIPAGTASVTLMSRTSRPYDVVGPFIDDRRVLGVLVGMVTLLEGAASIVVDTHLTQEDLAGWHCTESSRTMRWTKGDAVLPLGLSSEMRVLSVEVIAAGPYRQHKEQPVNLKFAG